MPGACDAFCGILWLGKSLCCRMSNTPESLCTQRVRLSKHDVDMVFYRTLNLVPFDIGYLNRIWMMSFLHVHAALTEVKDASKISLFPLRYWPQQNKCCAVLYHRSLQAASSTSNSWDILECLWIQAVLRKTWSCAYCSASAVVTLQKLIHSILIFAIHSDQWYTLATSSNTLHSLHNCPQPIDTDWRCIHKYIERFNIDDVWLYIIL